MRVLKLGGSLLEDAGSLEPLAAALRRLPGPCVLVHGGGGAVDRLQRRLGLTPEKVAGLRRTDAASLEAVVMALAGAVNKRLVAGLVAAGLPAVGLSGVDGGLVRCRKLEHPEADLGFVGQVTAVNPVPLQALLAQGLLPVVAPLSLGEDGHLYNVNADHVAGALARALRAEELVFLSDVPGVLVGGAPLARLTPAEAERLIAAGQIRDGMIPKVRTALEVLGRGVPKVRIVDPAGLAGGGTHVVAQTPVPEVKP